MSWLWIVVIILGYYLMVLQGVLRRVGSEAEERIRSLEGRMEYLEGRWEFAKERYPGLLTEAELEHKRAEFFDYDVGQS